MEALITYHPTQEASRLNLAEVGTNGIGDHPTQGCELGVGMPYTAGPGPKGGAFGRHHEGQIPSFGQAYREYGRG